jgi:hypothetical protein
MYPEPPQISGATLSLGPWVTIPRANESAPLAGGHLRSARTQVEETGFSKSWKIFPEGSRIAIRWP